MNVHEQEVIQVCNEAFKLFEFLYLNSYPEKLNLKPGDVVNFSNPASLERLAETLFVSENDSLYFEIRLAQNFTTSSLNLNKQLALVEEVSHFTFLVQSSLHEENVCLRDIEAWGEIDRFLFLLVQESDFCKKKLSLNLKKRKLLHHLFELFFNSKATFVGSDKKIYLEAQELAFLVLKKLFSGWLAPEFGASKNVFLLHKELLELRQNSIQFGLKATLHYLRSGLPRYA
jgi:hypothetical protein